MSTTLNNILGVSGKPTAPYTPPGIDSSLPGATGTQTRQSTTGTPPAKPEAPTPQEASAALKEATPQVTDVEKTQIEVKPQRVSYEEMFRLLNPYKPPTQEELEKERKKQRREQIFAAIGDGISALSNLFFTTQYAPNMYRPAETQSEKTKKRWDKLTAERNANMTAYINGLMRARQADDTYNDNERAWQRQLGLDKIKQERDKAADARAEAKEKRDAEMHDLNKQLRNNQITQAEYEAKKAEVEARYAPQLEQSKINRNKAAAGASNASASASRARARYYDRGGSGSGKKKNMQEAYDYWMSLTDEQKKQYRDWNNRYRKVKTGTDDDDNPIFTNQYMDDDDNFIQMVWKQRQGWLNSQGDFNKDDYRRGGSKKGGNSAPPLN